MAQILLGLLSHFDCVAIIYTLYYTGGCDLYVISLPTAKNSQYLYGFFNKNPKNAENH